MVDISRTQEGYTYPQPTGVTREGTIVNGTFTYRFGFDAGGSKSLYMLQAYMTNEAGDTFNLDLPGPAHSNIVNRDTGLYPTINDYLMGYDSDGDGVIDNTGWLETNHPNLYADGWVVNWAGNSRQGEWTVTVPGETVGSGTNNKYAPEGTVTIDIECSATDGVDTYYWGAVGQGSTSGYQVVDMDPAVSGGDNTGLDVATAEVTEVTIPGESSLTTGNYWTINSPSTNYYVWYNVDSGGGDPNLSGTGIPVAVNSGDSASVVASNTQTEIDAIGDFTATVSTDVVTVTNVNVGDVTDAADVDAGVSVNVTTQGVDDPTYTATIAVDGGSGTSIDVVGSAATTFTNLISELNTDLTGATASIDGNGDIKVTSDSTGVGSEIDITDGDLFSSISNYNAINQPVDGFNNVDIDRTRTYYVGRMLDIDDDGYEESAIVLDETNPNAIKVLDVRRMEPSMVANAMQLIADDPSGVGGPTDYDILVGQFTDATGNGDYDEDFYYAVNRYGPYIVTDVPNRAPGSDVTFGTPDGTTEGKKGEMWADGSNIYINVDGTTSGWMKASLSSI